MLPVFLMTLMMVKKGWNWCGGSCSPRPLPCVLSVSVLSRAASTLLHAEQQQKVETLDHVPQPLQPLASLGAAGTQHLAG